MVREELGRQPGIVLLDNLEHLLPAARSTIDWLHGQCPNSRVLVTSRHPVDATHEVRVELHPFVSEAGLSDESALEQDSVKLFINRATRRNPRFRLRPGDAAIVSELCNRFDGLPLAIELLAGWSDVLTPAEMRERGLSQLEQRSVSDDPRHQSLLKAIAWSYNLLTPEEQALFWRISIFVGGFSRDFVEKMVRGREAGAGYPYADGYGLESWFTQHSMPDPSFHNGKDSNVALDLPPLEIDAVRGLATLIDHHLVVPLEDIDGVPCFDMLETIREFGLGELRQSGEFDAAQHAHAAVMIAFAEASGKFLLKDATVQWGRQRIDAALPNLRSALNWTMGLGDAGSEIMIRISASLWIYWQTRGLLGEGRYWHETGLSRPTAPDWLRAVELPALGFLCWIQNDTERAEAAILEAFEASEQTGITITLSVANLVLALIEYRRVTVDVVRMLQYVDEAERWSLQWNDLRTLGACQLIYGIVARLTGNPDQALGLFEKGYELLVEAEYEWGIASARYFAAETVRDLAEHDPSRIPEAVAQLHESLELYWEQGDFWGTGGAMSGLACILTQLNEDVQAATFFGAAAALMQRAGASLLPTELMTHDETANRLRERMDTRLFDSAHQHGYRHPEETVRQALSAFGDPQKRGDPSPASIRLTKRQLAVVRDLAGNFDPTAISRRRGSEVSSTYEMLDRICERLGVDTWQQIAPFAIEHGLVAPPEPKSGQALGNWVISPENP